MITSVYISNDKIQVLTGDYAKGALDVKSCMYVSLPEKAVVNGTIANEVGVKEALQKLWDKYNLPKKGISLVIDSGTILNKKAVVPVLPKANIQSLVQDEFKDVDGYTNFLFDYVVIEDGHNGDPMVFCNAVSKELVASYIRVFKGLDIQLKSINTSIAAENAFVSIHPALNKDNEIIIYADGSSLTSVLYMDGKYSFCSRSRLVEQRATEGSFTEFARALSSLIQFARSENSQKPVKSIYICGLLPGEENLCGRLQSALGCPVTTLPACDNITCTKDKNKAAILMADYLYPLSNMINQ